MYTLTAVFLLLTVGQTLGGHGTYHGPEAKPVVKHDGFLADTHEVAAAKSLHLGALSQAAAHSGGDSHGDEGHHDHHDHHSHHHTAAYHGPQAIPKVLPDGHIADTHEVSAAKEAHLAALATAKGGHGHGGDSGHYTHDEHPQSSYHGPLAKPVVLPSGHLADTHEVASAKGAHLDALANAHH